MLFGVFYYRLLYIHELLKCRQSLDKGQESLTDVPTTQAALAHLPPDSFLRLSCCPVDSLRVRAEFSLI